MVELLPEKGPATIGAGYALGLDPSALVVGPAGLAYDSQHDRLYVASEDDNEIFVIENASTTSGGGKGTLVFTDPHLEGPLGLTIAPNGDLITANADPTVHQNAANPRRNPTPSRGIDCHQEFGGLSRNCGLREHHREAPAAELEFEKRARCLYYFVREGFVIAQPSFRRKVVRPVSVQKRSRR